MDDLIYDAVSIFTQILYGFAPDYAGDYGFLLAGYISACLFVLLVVWAVLRLVSAFGRVILGWFSRGA